MQTPDPVVARKRERRSEAIAANLVTIAFAVGGAHYLLGAPWWATWALISIEGAVNTVRMEVKYGRR